VIVKQGLKSIGQRRTGAHISSKTPLKQNLIKKKTLGFVGFSIRRDFIVILKLYFVLRGVHQSRSHLRLLPFSTGNYILYWQFLDFFLLIFQLNASLSRRFYQFFTKCKCSLWAGGSTLGWALRGLCVSLSSQRSADCDKTHFLLHSKFWNLHSPSLVKMRFSQNWEKRWYGSKALRSPILPLSQRKQKLCCRLLTLKVSKLIYFSRFGKKSWAVVKMLNFSCWQKRGSRCILYLRIDLEDSVKVTISAFCHVLILFVDSHRAVTLRDPLWINPTKEMPQSCSHACHPTQESKCG